MPPTAGTKGKRMDSAYECSMLNWYGYSVIGIFSKITRVEVRWVSAFVEVIKARKCARDCEWARARHIHIMEGNLCEAIEFLRRAFWLAVNAFWRLLLNDRMKWCSALRISGCCVLTQRGWESVASFTMASRIISFCIWTKQCCK